MAVADLALLAGAALMGFAGAPHCAAMCGATSRAAIGRCGPAGPFHVGRLLGYAAAGALAAASVGWLSQWSAVTPALRPLWAMAQAAALALGLWLLWTGRQPAWLGSARAPTIAPALAAQGWQPVMAPLRSGAAGMAWVAWPCGLLQSALVAASLASSAATGALAMALFAAASSFGLWGVHRFAGRADAAWAVRLGGGLLVLAAGWALAHGVWAGLAAFC